MEQGYSTFKVIVAGGRDFDNYELLKEKCDFYLQQRMNTDVVTIVSGHAKGADALGERYAIEHNIPIDRHPADWHKHGRAAGPMRNKEMAECADALIAFWNGTSRGTANMIALAQNKGLKVVICRY